MVFKVGTISLFIGLKVQSFLLFTWISAVRSDLFIQNIYTSHPVNHGSLVAYFRSTDGFKNKSG